MSNNVVLTKNKKTIRIALASGDGKRIDQHFARSPFFFIYEIIDTAPHFIENRENQIQKCFCGDENELQIFQSIIDLISDCQFIIALRIGNSALSFLIDHGIRAAQIDDTVDNALQLIISSGKLRYLTTR